MKYVKFAVRNYRAIDGPLEIDLSKESLIPIIGINECGKTTILQALFAFDHNNDALNDGRQIQDVANLYSLAPKLPKISARVELTFDELLEVITEVVNAQQDTGRNLLRSYRKQRSQFPGYIVITRDFETKSYIIDEPLLPYVTLNQAIAEEVIRRLPYILYFDDFRDSVADKVEIIKSHSNAGWLAIFETLFEKTDPSFSVFDLPKKEERQRKTVLAKVNRKLNATLTREWQNFRLDDADALQIAIEYYEQVDAQNLKRSYLKLDVIEKDVNGDDHYFFVMDRSKGFYWFFNFVMKLEFNPKVVEDSDVDAIYLLDEPGSYLHATAQSKLAVKLRNLSQKNKVVYCTHSHHLLDPEVIPINTIRIAEKDGNGRVRLIPIHEHKGVITERRSAYQPLLDALQIRPLALEIGQQPVVIVEGIVDYYLLEMFRAERKLTILPSVGADSVKYHISLMIAWRIKYAALWDSDSAGRDAHADATSYFGEREASAHFFLLPPRSQRARNTIIQNLVDATDLASVRTKLALPTNANFDKTIAGWFYSRERDNITGDLKGNTRNNFDQLLDSFHLT